MMSTEFVIFLFQMISPIVRYTKWDCKILFWVSISCFLSYRLSQWYTGSKLGLFLALDTYIKLKLMLQIYFFVWCDVILWHDIVVKREKTTCNLLNSTIYQELFSMGIICKFQMIHCIIKNMYANKLFKNGIIYYFLYVMFLVLGARRSCV